MSLRSMRVLTFWMYVQQRSIFGAVEAIAVRRSVSKNHLLGYATMTVVPDDPNPGATSCLVGEALAASQHATSTGYLPPGQRELVNWMSHLGTVVL